MFPSHAPNILGRYQNRRRRKKLKTRVRWELLNSLKRKQIFWERESLSTKRSVGKRKRSLINISTIVRKWINVRNSTLLYILLEFVIFIYLCNMIIVIFIIFLVLFVIDKLLIICIVYSLYTVCIQIWLKRLSKYNLRCKLLNLRILFL